MLQKLLISVIFIFFCIGAGEAQQSTGKMAEEAKKEILKIEKEKRQAFLSTFNNKNNCADWVNHNYAAGIEHVDAEGIMRTKSQVIDQLCKSARQELVSDNQTIQNIHVYGDGTDGSTAVVTFLGERTVEVNGQRSTNSTFGTEALVKTDGHWWIVSHSTHHLPPAGKSAIK